MKVDRLFSIKCPMAAVQKTLQRALVSVLYIVIFFTKTKSQTGLGQPVFKTEPSDSWIDKDNPSSRSIRLQCSAQGATPLTIRWYKDGVKINKPQAEITGGDSTGFLTLSYYVATPTVQDAGSYYCEASNSFRTITSQSAVVKLYEKPRFISQPKSTSVDLLTSATFHCQATGVPPPIYQWFYNGSTVPIPGATGPMYTVTASSHAVAGTYQCKVANDITIVSSAIAHLTVISVKPYLITALEVTKKINYGDQSQKLFCNGSGIPPVTNRWKKNGSIVPNANSHTLIPDKQTSANYTCEVFNILGVALSSVQVIIITKKPVVSTPYSINSLRTYIGYPLELHCTAVGIPKPSLSWEFKDFRGRMFQLQSVNGVYYKAKATEFDAGLYYCAASNLVGTTKNVGIFVVVDYRTPPPSFTATSALPALPTQLPSTAPQTLPTTSRPTTPAITTTAFSVTDNATLSNETNATDATSAAPFETTTIALTSHEVSSSAQTSQPPASTAVSGTSTPATNVSTAGATTGPDGGSEGSSVDTGAVVGGVLGGVLGFLLLSALIVIIYIRYRSAKQMRRRSSEKRLLRGAGSPMSMSSLPEDVQLDMDVMTSVNPELSLDFSKMKATSVSSQFDCATRLDIISMRELLEKVDEAINAGLRDNALSNEYNSTPLNMIGIEHMISGTEHKNRYMNVLPNMDTAVKLSPLSEGGIVSTYINANHMPSFDGETQPYIAAQGPTAETVDDFWRMIWEQDVSVIVMATQLVERGRAKCARYWPSDGVMELQYGKFNVVVNDITNFESYILTEMSIFKTEDDGKVDFNEAKTVRHFWFQAWPDFGIPQSTETFTNFLKVVWDARKNSESPMLLHCSAGIGRTGTLMAVHMGMQEFDVSGRVDPHKYMEMLRASRGGCIQTIDQYLFIHRALYTYMQQTTKAGL